MPPHIYSRYLPFDPDMCLAEGYYCQAVSQNINIHIFCSEADLSLIIMQYAVVPVDMYYSV